MSKAYQRKLRFVQMPGEPPVIADGLIPESCRDEYGVDAVKLVKHLEERINSLSCLLAVTRADRDNMKRLILGVPE